MPVNISFHFKVKLLKVSLSWLENFNILKSYFLRFEERRSPLALTDFSERRSRSRSLIFFRAPLALALAILGAPLASAAHRAALSNTLLRANTKVVLSGFLEFQNSVHFYLVISYILK